jgi:hypothetical protein
MARWARTPDGGVCYDIQSSLRDLKILLRLFPALKALGYYQEPLSGLRFCLHSCTTEVPPLRTELRFLTAWLASGLHTLEYRENCSVRPIRGLLDSGNGARRRVTDLSVAGRFRCFCCDGSFHARN